MPKGRAEVPEEAICKLAAAALPQGVRVLLDYQDEPSDHLPLDAARALLAEALPALHKAWLEDFKERLLSDEATEAGKAAADFVASRDTARCIIEAALQAASTPEGER